MEARGPRWECRGGDQAEPWGGHQRGVRIDTRCRDSTGRPSWPAELQLLSLCLATVLPFSLPIGTLLCSGKGGSRQPGLQMVFWLIALWVGGSGPLTVPPPVLHCYPSTEPCPRFSAGQREKWRKEWHPSTSRGATRTCPSLHLSST